jgi:CheY-like chemotaxis protein/nitrogen-specific signal transduction histidine kinase
MKLSSNDMSVELEKNKYQDEVGDMIASVQIFKDNTEKLIESEHQIKLAMREATSANKAKSTFLARMSHELRTPLNAILGFANLLRKSSNINEQEKKNLEVIKRSGNHLLNIINEILELSKIEAGKIELVPKTFELHELIKDIESMFAFRCESKGLNFNLNVDSNVPNIIKADEQRLRQILINLLGNSLKFTINGEITLNIYAQNKKLFFEVKDTGIGIDIQNQKKIFKPFEQIKKDDYNSQGTGLGLSITKELISLMGGTIYLKSFIGKGSEFYFSINYEKSVKNKLEEKIFTKDIAGIADVNDDKTILVVDDIKENRDLVVQILNQYGFKTYEASSGEEAIDIFKAHSIDLIFMDILMSGLDGLETTQIIRKDLNKKDIPIIALSANVFEEDKQKAYNSGANDFLSKPFDEKELINILQKYLNIEVVFEKQEKVDFKLSFENVPKDFFEKLIYYCLQMDNESIKDLISTNKLDKKSKKFLEDFLEDFDYQSILKICEKYK